MLEAKIKISHSGNKYVAAKQHSQHNALVKLLAAGKMTAS
jgi:hypothetical protein